LWYSKQLREDVHTSYYKRGIKTKKPKGAEKELKRDFFVKMTAFIHRIWLQLSLLCLALIAGSNSSILVRSWLPRLPGLASQLILSATPRAKKFQNEEQLFFLVTSLVNMLNIQLHHVNKSI